MAEYATYICKPKVLIFLADLAEVIPIKPDQIINNTLMPNPV